MSCKDYKKAITFSYDDGVIFDEKLIDIFDKYGMKGTFNIHTGFKEGEEIEKGWVTPRGLRVLRNDFMKEKTRHLYDGHEVAGHSRHHYWLTKLDDEALQEEIIGNRDDLKQIFGTEISGIAYPFNTYDDRAVKILQDHGFLYAREGRENHSFDLQDDLLRFHPTCHHNDPKLFDLAQEFLKAEYDELKIFYVWGHSYEFADENNWDRIEQFCKLVGGRSDIFYGTNKEVFEKQLNRKKR